jgi:hypothetical protein
VRQLVAEMFDILDAPRVFRVSAAFTVHHFDEYLRGVVYVRGHLRKEREVLFLFRQKIKKRHRKFRLRQPNCGKKVVNIIERRSNVYR